MDAMSFTHTQKAGFMIVGDFAETVFDTAFVVELEREVEPPLYGLGSRMPRKSLSPS